MKNMRVCRDGDRVLISFEGDTADAERLIDTVRQFMSEGQAVEQAPFAPAVSAPMAEPDEVGEPVRMEPEKHYPPRLKMKQQLVEWYRSKNVPQIKYSNLLAKADDAELRALYDKMLQN